MSHQSLSRDILLLPSLPNKLELYVPNISTLVIHHVKTGKTPFTVTSIVSVGDFLTLRSKFKFLFGAPPFFLYK